MIRHFRPVFAAIGFAVFMIVFNYLAKQTGLQYLSQIFGFLPKMVMPLIGLLFVLTWVPVFVGGIRFLGVKTAAGGGDKLITDGIYQYIRNPMYSGTVFTLFGFGLISNLTGVAFTPVLGFFISTWLVKQEEKTLTKKYGVEYLGYKQKTPAFIPNFAKLIKAVFVK